MWTERINAPKRIPKPKPRFQGLEKPKPKPNPKFHNLPNTTIYNQIGSLVIKVPAFKVEGLGYTSCPAKKRLALVSLSMNGQAILFTVPFYGTSR